MNSSKIKIAAIADCHYQFYDPGSAAQRQGYFADIMLLRTAHRLNRYIQPDIVLILGDLMDEPHSVKTADHLRRLRDILSKLDAPYLVLPGNHDPAPDVFYRVFPRPPRWLDVKGVRFLPFIDRQTDGFNASRDAVDIGRFAAARRDFSGPIAALQHVPLFPPGRDACPYNYTNAPEIIAAMRAQGATLSISGHYHKGLHVTMPGAATYLAAPALCEAPFQFLVMELEGGKTAVTKHALANSADLYLTDFHVHTPYAYCNENMDICQSLKLGRLFGLEHMVFSEHSGHLYFDKSDYWPGRFLRGATPLTKDRVADYFAAAGKLDQDFAVAGMELDCDYNGQPVIRPEHRHLPRAPIGAVHFLPELTAPRPDPAKAGAEFLGMLERFLGSGISILAHPLRVFKKSKCPLPASIFPELARLLRENGVAAELNFHTNQPAPEFFRICLENGVKIAFGSDAHNLYEIGEFYPHLRFLREDCGYDGDLNDILVDFQAIKDRRLG